MTIIGIIAAMTIPNLLHKYMQKELEVAFNKSVALLNQGLLQMAYDEGAGLTQSYAIWDGTSYNGDSLFSNFHNYIKIEKQMYSRDLYKTTGAYRNFNNDTLADSYTLAYPTSLYRIYVSPSGMTYKTIVSSYTINIIVDTNGAKGPNRAGYDYFYLAVSSQDRITSNPNFTLCSRNDTSDKNGLGCSKYAIINKCPWDESKTYWECLK